MVAGLLCVVYNIVVNFSIRTLWNPEHPDIWTTHAIEQATYRGPGYWIATGIGVMFIIIGCLVVKRRKKLALQRKDALALAIKHSITSYLEEAALVDKFDNCMSVKDSIAIAKEFDTAARSKNEELDS